LLIAVTSRPQLKRKPNSRPTSRSAAASDRDRLGRVEDLAWFVAGQERVNLFLAA
jgi:hypothetical protein